MRQAYQVGLMLCAWRLQTASGWHLKFCLCRGWEASSGRLCAVPIAGGALA